MTPNQIAHILSAAGIHASLCFSIMSETCRMGFTDHRYPTDSGGQIRVMLAQVERGRFNLELTTV